MEDDRSLDLRTALRLPRPSSFSRPRRLPRFLPRPGRSTAASAARLSGETFPGSSERSCRLHSPDRETAVSDPDGLVVQSHITAGGRDWEPDGLGAPNVVEMAAPCAGEKGPLPYTPSDTSL